MGELTAKKDQPLSGWDIRFLVPFWPEPDIKKWPDIRPTGTGYPVHPYEIHCVWFGVCFDGRCRRTKEFRRFQMATICSGGLERSPALLARCVCILFFSSY